MTAQLRVPANLPDPGPAARAHVAPLLEVIAGEIARAGGAIPFARYLELSLYSPGLGYYSGPLDKLGPSGDFVTAPEVSPLFGRCVARQAAQVLEALGGGIILELGAGSGALAADVLLTLDALERLPSRYLILEVSAGLRARQTETLRRRAPHLFERLAWLDRWPARPIEGVVVANEVLDAVPFHRVRRGAAGALEDYVTLREGRFDWQGGPLSTPQLESALAGIESDLGEPLPSGYVSEVAPARDAWVRSLAEVLARGLVILADYGFPRREYYHPQRVDGTLMCHYRQRAHGDPLALTGLQDVTAHVDFTAAAGAAAEAGLEVAGFVSQADFLLATGLLEDLAAARGEWERLALAGEAKRLTLPGLMGEAFKVLALTRALDIALSGFGLRDRRGRL